MFHFGKRKGHSIREYNMVEQKVTHVHKQWAHALNVHIDIYVMFTTAPLYVYTCTGFFIGGNFVLLY